MTVYSICLSKNWFLDVFFSFSSFVYIYSQLMDNLRLDTLKIYEDAFLQVQHLRARKVQVNSDI